MFPLNLGRFGNSIAIWLGIEPYELFFYIFLPPLLFDAAVRIDFFMFKKVRPSGQLLICCGKCRKSSFLCNILNSSVAFSLRCSPRVQASLASCSHPDPLACPSLRARI